MHSWVVWEAQLRALIMARKARQSCTTTQPTKVMNLTESYLKITKSPWVLSRKSGLFYRRRIFLDNVVEILSINRDAITHDEIQICFKCSDNREFLISEFDRNFKEVVDALKLTFPGIENWNKVSVGAPLEHRMLTLWSK